MHKVCGEDSSFQGWMEREPSQASEHESGSLSPASLPTSQVLPDSAQSCPLNVGRLLQGAHRAGLSRLFASFSRH